MAYLTRYNCSKLCRTLDINTDIDLEFFTTHIHNNPKIYYILNKLEREYLFKQKAILKDEKQFQLTYFEKVPENEDTFNYVFESTGKVKYHLYEDCSLLNKNFLNFQVPKEVKDLGEKEVINFRNWFIANDFEMLFKTKDKEQAKKILNNRYNAKYSTQPYNFKQLDENSNILVINVESKKMKDISNNNFDVKKFESELDECIKQWYNAFQCPISRKISKFKYLLKRDNLELKSKIDEVFTDGFTDNYGIKNLRDKFKLAKTLNNQIILLLIDYFRWTYSADTKSFDKIVLEDFGLACCSNCAKIGHEKYLENQGKQ